MANKLKSFGVFCNRIVGQKVKAIDFMDLLRNRMTNKMREFWSEVKFIDDQGRTIVINREFLIDQGMSFDEVVEDWLMFADESDLSEEIHTI